MGAFGCFRTDAELAPSPAEVRPLILTRVKQDPKPEPAAEIRRAAFVRKLLLGHVVREPMHAAILEWKAKTKSEIRQSGYVLAGMCYFIFFFHYCVATCLSSFFADYATDRNVSNSVVGVIFAACPLGISIASPLAVYAIASVGLRNTIMCGILLEAVWMLLFGLVPSFFGGAELLQSCCCQCSDSSALSLSVTAACCINGSSLNSTLFS